VSILYAKKGAQVEYGADIAVAAQQQVNIFYLKKKIFIPFIKGPRREKYKKAGAEFSRKTKRAIKFLILKWAVVVVDCPKDRSSTVK